MKIYIYAAIIFLLSAECGATGNLVKPITDKTTIDGFTLSNCTVNPWMEKAIKQYTENRSQIIQQCIDSSISDDMDSVKAGCARDYADELYRHQRLLDFSQDFYKKYDWSKAIYKFKGDYYNGYTDSIAGSVPWTADQKKIVQASDWLQMGSGAGHLFNAPAGASYDFLTYDFNFPGMQTIGIEIHSLPNKYVGVVIHQDKNIMSGDPTWGEEFLCDAQLINAHNIAVGQP